MIKIIPNYTVRENKRRILYGITFFIFLTIEILIALFVHDSFIRPYIGDVLVVVVLYFAVRILIPSKINMLPLYIFLFAAGIEGLQYFHLVHILRVEDNTFLRTLIGATFDIKDIICYGIGCILLEVYERFCIATTTPNNNNKRFLASTKPNNNNKPDDNNKE